MKFFDTRVTIFCLLLLLPITLVACGSRQDDSPTTQPAATALPATDTPMPTVEPTIAPTAIPQSESETESVEDGENTETAAPEAEEVDTPEGDESTASEPEEAGTEEAGQETGEETGEETDEVAQAGTDADAADAASVWTTIEQADAIQSYRMHISMLVTQTQPEAGTIQQTVSIEGAFVKEPPTEEILMELDEGRGEINLLGSVLVGDTRYIRFGEQWQSVPATSELALYYEEMTVITPEHFTATAHLLTVVGVEEVNGRQTTHYHGDQDLIYAVSGDDVGLQSVDRADVDLWVDEAEQFIVKMEIVGEELSDDGASIKEQAYVMQEYYDINSDVSISAPEIQSP